MQSADEADRAARIPTREAGSAVDVVVEIKSESAVARGPISLLGLAPDKVDQGWLTLGSQPDFFFTSPDVDLKGTVRFSAALAPNLNYIVIVNQDDDRLPGPADLVSAPTAFSGKSPFEATVDRTLDSVLSARIGSSSAPTAVEPVPTRAVVLSLEGQAAPSGPTRLMLVGRADKPTKDASMDSMGFFWRSEPFEATTWPHTVEAPVPKGLYLYAMLDRDGDGMPSPGDLSVPQSEPIKVRRSGPIEATLSTPFSPAARPGQAPQGTPQTPPGDDDDDDAAPTRPVTKSGIQRGDAATDVRSLTLATDVRLPFIRTGRFIVLGLADGTGEFGWGELANAPFIWASAPQRLNWPVVVEAPLPEGLDLMIVLDLDGSGVADSGDLTSTPKRGLKRPASGGMTFDLKEIVPVTGG